MKNPLVMLPKAQCIRSWFHYPGNLDLSQINALLLLNHQFLSHIFILKNDVFT